MNRYPHRIEAATKRAWHLCLVPILLALAACAAPRPHKVSSGGSEIECGVEASVRDERCFLRTPEVSANPPYTLHFVEFDDQGWLYPSPAEKGYVAEMGSAHDQIDYAVRNLASRLAQGERVLLLVYVHGWKHSAAHDDRDVRRFRQMLSDAAMLDEETSGGGAVDVRHRRVVGIYVGWRGAGRFSRSNPLVYLTFWTRKNAALHISEGAARELFARVRALRERWNMETETRPRLRTVVMGHSFGGWIVFSALSPSILELLARADLDADGDSTSAMDAWRKARLRSAADMVILVNPAFEATRYQPIHNLARRVRLPKYEPPTLLLVTSKADPATGTAFPLGRFFNTLFQRPFVSEEEEYAATRTPGFVDRYITHQLTSDGSTCPGWRSGEKEETSAEEESVRKRRMRENAAWELARHDEWRTYLADRQGALPPGWKRQFCGGTAILHQRYEPHWPVWNVVTDGRIIPNHSDIMGESLHAFFRQLYLDLPH